MNKEAKKKKKVFYLDVIINDVFVNANEEIDANTISVVLTIGELTHVIESSRDPCTGFREGRSITFKDNPDALRKRFQDNPIKLQINDLNFGEEEDEEDEAHEEEETDGFIGDAQCLWPNQLLHEMVADEFTEFTFGQTCKIIRDTVEVGYIVLAVMLRAQCCEDPSTVNKEFEMPCLDAMEKLCELPEIENKISPDDVFFVIGQKPEPRGRYDPCDDHPKLQTSRYKFLRGTLVKECTLLKSDCCSPAARQARLGKRKEECRQCPLPEYNQKPCPHQQRNSNRGGVCPSAKCNQIFGNSGLDGSKMSESDGYSQSSEDFTARCQRSNYGRRKDSSARGRQTCRYDDSSPDYSTKDNGYNNILNNVEVVSSTCDQMNEAANKNKPRCKVCCQILAKAYKDDICPRCDIYSITRKFQADNLTADDILEEWNLCEIKSNMEGNQGPAGCATRCTCGPDKECPFCRVKKMYQDDFAQDKNNQPIIFDVPNMDDPNKVKLPNASEICNEMLDKYSDKPHLQKVLGWLKEKVLSKKFKNDVGISRTFGKSKTKEKDPCETLKKKDGQQVGDGAKNKTSKTAFAKNPKMQMAAPPPSPPRETPKKFAKRMKKRYRRKYCYSHGNSKMESFGRHNHCVVASQKVPPNMGWLWNINGEDLRGWRPGAIKKPIRELMQYFLQEFPVDTLPTTQEIKAMIRPPLPEKKEDLTQKPTVRIRKKDGKYTIIMHPLKDIKTLKTSANPYIKAPPLVFTITKKPMAKKRREVKQSLKKMGFQKCSCKKPISSCICRSYMEKKRLEQATEQVCTMLDAPDLKDTVALSDTTDSDSEIDIEFTPPAGIIKPHLAQKPDMYSQTTQYCENDFTIKLKRRTFAAIRREILEKKELPPCPGPIIPPKCPQKRKIVKDLTDKIRKGEMSLLKPKKPEKASELQKKDSKIQSKVAVGGDKKSSTTGVKDKKPPIAGDKKPPPTTADKKASNAADTKGKPNEPNKPPAKDATAKPPGNEKKASAVKVTNPPAAKAAKPK